MAEIEKVKLPNDDTIYDIKDAKAIRGLASGTTSGHVLQFGTDGYTVSDSGKSMSDKQDTIDSSHKLSADLIDDTSTTNKFATAAQLTQIETNKNNIVSINNNLIYSPTEPTGNISDGAIWVNTAASQLSDFIKKYHIVTITTGSFEQGTLAESSAVGSTYEQTKSATQSNRIRTTQLVETASSYTISADFTTYQLYILYFDNNMLYTGTHSNSWLSAPITISNKPYIGIIARRLDNGDISPTADIGLVIQDTTIWHSNNS